MFPTGTASSGRGGGSCLSRRLEVAEWVRRGPDLVGCGVARWRRVEVACTIEARFGVALAGRNIDAVLRRPGFERLVVRRRHPGKDAAAQASFGPASRASWTQPCQSTPAASRLRSG